MLISVFEMQISEFLNLIQISAFQIQLSAFQLEISIFMVEIEISPFTPFMGN